ncbi:hypothetical protein SETIT_7G261800v2 [Setaria italica]|uniref:Uncharacterized protein n=2 Tax=Setaria TaxID=4554 RepID=A0A368RZY4_SETIT|nr:hypothetical protein SETIT_7G261800v2 [Setaria italica]TKW06929.1 hypothetical protein SEVIR_7G273400v2 [Setaria viridis]
MAKTFIAFAILLLATSQLAYVVTSRQLPVENPKLDASSSLINRGVGKGGSNGEVGKVGSIGEEKAILYAPNMVFRPPRITPCKARAC